MYILTQEGADMINADKAARIFVNIPYNTICVSFYDKDDKKIPLGHYTTYNAALTVLSRIFQALEDNKSVFEMPDRQESNLWLHLDTVECEMRNQ